MTITSFTIYRILYTRGRTASLDINELRVFVQVETSDVTNCSIFEPRKMKFVPKLFVMTQHIFILNTKHLYYLCCELITNHSG